MIKAVFFDLYHTLISYDPPREESLSASLGRRGIVRSPQQLRRPLIAADEYFYEQGSRKGMSQRNHEETMALWANYQAVLLTEAGLQPEPALIQGILSDMQKIKYEMVLFDDVLPAFTGLVERGLLLGLISNIDKDVIPILDKVGITAWLQVKMTSAEAGVTKPHPAIFQRAVAQAGLANHEVLYVGDQYQVDVLDARQAGLKALLIDRGGYFDDVPKAEKICGLAELPAHLG